MKRKTKKIKRLTLYLFILMLITMFLVGILYGIIGDRLLTIAHQNDKIDHLCTLDNLLVNLVNNQTYLYVNPYRLEHNQTFIPNKITPLECDKF